MAAAKNQFWTIRKLIQNTYTNMHSRIEYKDRDVLKYVYLAKVSVYDGKKPGEAKTKYVIHSFSYPQYYPYYTKKDNRNRPRKYQRTYKHKYDVTIQMKTLSLDETDIKIRTGSDCKVDFSKEGRGHFTGKGRNKRYIEGNNIKKGRNLDFFFRLEYLYSYLGILYGRNWTNGPALKANPKNIVFLDKHALSVLEYLVNRGIIQ